MTSIIAAGSFPRALRYGIAIVGVISLVIVLGGCNIQEKREGDNKRVDIKTPFGNLKVDTNADARDTGLPVYPGAQLKATEGDNSNKANVNINTSFFGLKVIAATYTSEDAPEKVLSFYGNEMKKYGDVLRCRGGSVGDVKIKEKPGSGDGELTCDKEDHDSSATELKVGTKSKQRVVVVKPNGKGSEFSVVMVQTRNDEGAL